MRSWVWRVFRLLFFGILAVDTFEKFTGRAEDSALLVSKIPLIFEEGLDWVPSARFLARLYGIVAAAAAVASLGPEWLYPRAAAVAATCYNVAYFGDTTDRYQHHYLLCMLLALLPLVPTHAWVRRLMVVQLAIVYFWTAISKITDGGLFLAGHFVRSTSQRRIVYDTVHTIADTIGVADADMWHYAAIYIVASQVVLSVLLLTGYAPRLMVALGVVMHLGFEVVGRLSIGYFSWYMLTVYMLLAPWPEAEAKNKSA